MWRTGADIINEYRSRKPFLRVGDDTPGAGDSGIYL
jgi:hypothetical protein